MKHSHIASESSRKHHRITSESSRKHHRNTSELSRKRNRITSESACKHRTTSVLSREYCRDTPVSSRKCPFHRRHCTSLSAMALVDCLSSCGDSIVTRNENVTTVQQSHASNCSGRSNEFNSANESSELLSSSSSAAGISASSGPNMEYAVQDYTPLIIDATNISKNRRTYLSNSCSVVNCIIGRKSECVEMVCELDDQISNVPGRKRRHADRLEPHTVQAKISDTPAACKHMQKCSQHDTLAACKHKQKCLQHDHTPAASKHNQKCSRHKATSAVSEHKQKYLQHEDKPAVCKHKQKCSQHEDTSAARKHKQKCSQHDDDTSSVISLGSDDEVEIIDSDPKPQLEHSNMSDVIDTLPARKSETVTIDLCTPSDNSELPVLTQKYMNHKDEKISRSNYKFCEPAFKEYVSVLGNGFHASHSRPHDVPSVTSHVAFQDVVQLASPASACSASDPVVNSGVEKVQDCEVIFISGGKEGNQMNVASVCGSSLQYRHCNDVRKSLQPIHNQMDLASAPSSSVYGSNLYNPHPDTVRMGLRPVVIDGSNVAMGHSNGRIFSCRGLQICIDYFLQRKHRVVAFVPQFRKSSFHSQDTAILDSLEKQGLVSFTPSRRIGNQLVVPYDDRYIVQYAAECGGVIVSTDNYRDLLEENPAWRETIEKRLLMFTWVGDVLMFPQDPLGRHGPNLENFLRFP